MRRETRPAVSRPDAAHRPVSSEQETLHHNDRRPRWVCDVCRAGKQRPCVGSVIIAGARCRARPSRLQPRRLRRRRDDGTGSGLHQRHQQVKVQVSARTASGPASGQTPAGKSLAPFSLVLMLCLASETRQIASSPSPGMPLPSGSVVSFGARWTPPAYASGFPVLNLIIKPVLAAVLLRK